MRHPQTCPLCEAMCGLEIEHDGAQVLRIQGDALDPLSRGYLCPKAIALQDLHNDPDRLRQPLVRGADGVLREASWEEALDTAANLLHSTRAQHGPDAIALYQGNPTVHNAGALLATQVLAIALGVRKTFSASSMDQLPHMLAAWQMFGHQLLMPVPDIDRADHAILLGANPAASNGSLMSAPGVASRLKAISARGGRVVVIDPRRTETARIANEHIFIRPATDALLLLAMLDTLFQEGLIRVANGLASTTGLSDLRALASAFPAERVAAATGIPADTTRRLAHTLTQERAFLYARLGACTQRYGGLAAWLAYAINVVTGHLDTPGGLMRPTPPVDLLVLGKLLGRSGSYDRWRTAATDLPEVGGELPVAALAAELHPSGPVRALLTVAGNPALSAPNAPRLQRALSHLDAFIAVDLYLNETTRRAHVILPPCSHLERLHFDLALQSFAVRNVARWTDRMFSPPPGARADFDLLTDLTARTLALRRSPQARLLSKASRLLHRAGEERVLDALIQLGPRGRLNPRSRDGLSLAKLRRHPHGIDLGALRPGDLGRHIATPDGRVHLAPPLFLNDAQRLRADFERGDLDPTAGALLLIGRRHLRSNNSWLHNSDRLTRGKPRCTLLIHPDDAHHRGIHDDDEVEIRSAVGAVRAPAELTDDVMPGVVSLPHGWGHDDPHARLRVAAQRPGVNANVLTDDAQIDPLSTNAVLTGFPVTITPVHTPIPTHPSAQATP